LFDLKVAQESMRPRPSAINENREILFIEILYLKISMREILL
jgi:hypothetical protein